MAPTYYKQDRNPQYYKQGTVKVDNKYELLVVATGEASQILKEGKCSRKTLLDRVGRVVKRWPIKLDSIDSILWQDYAIGGLSAVPHRIGPFTTNRNGGYHLKKDFDLNQMRDISILLLAREEYTFPNIRVKSGTRVKFSSDCIEITVSQKGQYGERRSQHYAFYIQHSEKCPFLQDKKMSL